MYLFLFSMRHRVQIFHYCAEKNIGNWNKSLTILQNIWGGLPWYSELLCDPGFRKKALRFLSWIEWSIIKTTVATATNIGAIPTNVQAEIIWIKNLGTYMHYASS